MGFNLFCGRPSGKVRFVAQLRSGAGGSADGWPIPSDTEVRGLAGSVQSYMWGVFPGLAEIPKLDTLEGPTFAGKINNAGFPFRGKAITYSQHFRTAVSVSHNYSLAEDGVAPHSKLNGAERTLLIVDSNSFMVLPLADTRASQKPPHDAVSGESHARSKG